MKIFNFDEIESSQNKAKELLLKESLPFVVCAQSQIKGKATKGRSWFSPQGGLYFSLALALDFNLLELDMAKFSKQACLSVVEVLKNLLIDENQASSLDDLSVKPINDLYYKDAKLAGVLLESMNNNTCSELIIGIGLNIEKLENAELDRKIISLKEILTEADFADFNKLDFIEKLAKALCENFSVMQKLEFS